MNKPTPISRRAREPKVNALLIGADQNEMEIYSDLIREVAPCQIDVITRLDPNFEWMSRGNYDLIDFDMPSESAALGIEILEKMRRTNLSNGIIVLSSEATVDQAVAAMKLGVEDFFGKPFDLDSFKLAVKRSLSRKEFIRKADENQNLSPFLNLINICQMISGAMEEERIFRLVHSYLSTELGDTRPCLAAVYGWDGTKYSPVSLSDSEKASEEVLDIAIQTADPFTKMKGGVGNPLDLSYLFIDRGPLTPGLFVFHFRCAGNQELFCVCLSPKKPADLETFETRLRMLRAQIEVTGSYIRQYKGVQQLAYLDDATGLYNARYLSTVLDREIALAEKGSKPFALLFIDADHFKQVNDQYGHLVGTKLLNAMGRHLKKYVRETDTVFRYGGDEFIAVLSMCDLKTAQVVAERIRHSVEKKEFLAAEGLHIKFTVSIGVALYPDHAHSKKEIIEAADQAMYGAKKASRNSVFFAVARKTQEA
jgi:two-component system cell cycle response regulator